MNFGQNNMNFNQNYLNFSQNQNFKNILKIFEVWKINDIRSDTMPGKN